jgi:hypothetical protein
MHTRAALDDRRLYFFALGRLESMIMNCMAYFFS